MGNKEYYQPHIAEAREKLLAMLEAIDSDGLVLSVESGREIKAAVNEPKTQVIFVRMQLSDPRTSE